MPAGAGRVRTNVGGIEQLPNEVINLYLKLLRSMNIRGRVSMPRMQCDSFIFLQKFSCNMYWMNTRAKCFEFSLTPPLFVYVYMKKT